MRLNACRFEKTNAFAAIVAACVITMQALFVGLAIGAAPLSPAGEFFCAKSTSADTSQQAPAAPKGGRHLSCCILHHGALGGLLRPVAPAFSNAFLPSAESVAPHFKADAIKIAPEIALLAARPPPSARA